MSLEELLERDTPTLTNMHKLGTHQPTKRNYSNLVAALQTVGYSISGFIATAVASFDGQPIAQVTIDDIDISQLCSYFSNILQGVLMSLKEGNGSDYEDTVITSADRHILLRIVGSDKEAFHVLITTREAKPSESLEVMTNVDAAIVAALH
jgi:predicted regulator of Ras-like GTPase activity (Roadblock/LC7/MglB family)